MCGFVGVLGDAVLEKGTLRAMSSTMVHRGPDDEGVWFDRSAAVALAHRRLSIVDLSPEGHQPMVSPSGRYVIALNGEIYNHRSLRSDLERLGGQFRGHSDTEVFLSAVETWGLKSALTRSTGMFAFALYDRKERLLSLVRDRMGEKPLYYGWQGEGKRRVFLFGSELKALRKHPSWRGGVDRDALAQLLRYNYIPAPQTIHPGVKKLLPGVLVQYRQGGSGEWSETFNQPWWSFQTVAKAGSERQFAGSEADAVEELDRLLKQVVQEQSVADVAVGAFLSGGIDSSSIVAIMQSVSERPVESFTIGYDDVSYDESSDAKRIAAQLGTNHHEWIITARDAMGVIPELPTLYDEPFADASQIPTTLVSRFARSHVTVSLSGDGGDELFGGYNRHYWAPRLLRKFGNIPAGLRAAVSGGVKSISPSAWDSALSAVEFLLPNRLVVRQPGEKIHKIARLMGAADEYDLYSKLVSAWDDPLPILGNLGNRAARQYPGALWESQNTFSEKMMALDAVTYLPDDILMKVDRAAMSTSLESRIPLLDHRIVEFSLRLPLEMKIHNSSGKSILRKVLDRYVPRPLMERPKSGFGLPLHEWLRAPLREWGEELLSEKRLREEGFFDVSAVRSTWEEHLSGRRNNQYLLWSVLMFQAWNQ
ncbi:MAG: asparagine synthase (glutamine-hydrolyzing) [Gammaproteobacteria bacterium]|nr:asparagine synthase (glutamine-hydrolyzing) [Gammaproteobacteria bacterium]